MHNKKWLKIWFLITLLIPIIGVFNYLVDPYGYFDNDKKFITNLSRVSKPQILNNKIHSPSTMYLVGTSRVERVNPQLIEQYTKRHVQNINISGGVLSENLLITQKLKSLNKHFIYGFDCFSLNEYRIQNFYKINNRHMAYKKELLRTKNIYLTLLDADITLLSIKHLLNQLKGKEFNEVEIKENNKQYEYDKDRIMSRFNGTKEQTSYKNYTVYSNSDIIKQAKIATDKDIFIIYPKHFFYYKLFQKYNDIEMQYFQAITTLVENTDAQVWMFYGKNDITTNKDNFDKDGWHFKPKIAKLIFAKIYNDNSITVPENFGYLLNKENVIEYLQNTSKEIKSTI